MSTNALSGFSERSLASLFDTALLQSHQRQTDTPSTTGTSTSQTSDHTQLSPFARLVATLQTLQQTKASQYQQVAEQIATNLHNAAHNAQANGNTAEATQLTQLATDFSNASNTGQLPNLQDLAIVLANHQKGGASHNSYVNQTESILKSPSNTDSSGSNAQELSGLDTFVSSLQTSTAQDPYLSGEAASSVANSLSSYSSANA